MPMEEILLPKKSYIKVGVYCAVFHINAPQVEYTKIAVLEKGQKPNEVFAIHNGNILELRIENNKDTPF